MMPAPRRARPAALVATALAAASLLAGCSASADVTGRPDDVIDQGYQSGDGTTQTWPVGQRSEPVTITGTDYEGNTVDTTDWLGDVVVLNTWYAGCPPCRAEAPDLVAISEDYAGRVHLLGINGTDDAGAAQAFQRTFGVQYPSIQDTNGGAMAALAAHVPVQAVPSTVVLDQEGRVAARVVGLVEGSTLRGLLDDVLAETTPKEGP